MKKMNAQVDPLGLSPCFGAICMICSMYVDFPECLGCSVQGDLLCLNMDCASCKRLATEGECCALMTGDISVVVPKTCVLAAGQVCCIHCGVALPPDDDVAPCTLALFGLVCCYKYQCQMPPICCEIRENMDNSMEVTVTN